MRALTGDHLFAFDAAGNYVALLAATARRNDPAAVLADWVREHGVLPCADIYAELVIGERTLAARFWNPDRSEEAICGNALRCVPLVLEALFGAVAEDAVDIVLRHARSTARRHAAGVCGFSFPADRIAVERTGANELLVDCGTPHRVIRVGDVRGAAVQLLGETLSAEPAWVNATFVARGAQQFAIRTFERGAGETGSCGSGALAAFVALTHGAAGAARAADLAFRFPSGEILNVRRCGAPPDAVEVRGRCALVAHDAHDTAARAPAARALEREIAWSVSS